MFNDRLVAKGTILLMVTDIFRQFIAVTGSVDDLVVLLTKAKIANRLLDYFPPGQQTETAFQEHFQKEGLDKLVSSYKLASSFRTDCRRYQYPSYHYIMNILLRLPGSHLKLCEPMCAILQTTMHPPKHIIYIAFV